jgi:hypothetical protein
VVAGRLQRVEVKLDRYTKSNQRSGRSLNQEDHASKAEMGQYHCNPL